MKEGERLEAVRGFFDGGVSWACQGAIKNKVGAAYVVQVARKKAQEMKWRHSH